MRFLRIALLCLVLAPAASLAEEFATLADAKAMADRAVALFAKEKFREGYAEKQGSEKTGVRDDFPGNASPL